VIISENAGLLLGPGGNLTLLCQYFAIPDLDRPVRREGHAKMRRGRREVESDRHGREALALLALLKGNFACSVRRLSGRMATLMIDLAARN